MKDDNFRNLSYRILFLGDKYVGKTKIIDRFVDKTYCDNYTCNLDNKFKKIEINNTNINIIIIDTDGQERFRSLIKSQYKGKDGFIIGFSLTDEKSFQSVTYWIEQIKENVGNNRPISFVLFGNKSDDKKII